MPDSLPHLETFTRVADLGSFTHAANELGITQAGVSCRIQALEDSLGRQLFNRNGRVSLTEAGSKLYEYARQILDLQRRARLEICRRVEADVR